MPSGEGLEWVSGVVRPDGPVKFHVHPGPHVLTPTRPITVTSKNRGRFMLDEGEPLLVLPHEEHELSIEFGEARYSCVGFVGKI